jgi:oligosaccharide repeat unit polymerase
MDGILLLLLFVLTGLFLLVFAYPPKKLGGINLIEPGGILIGFYCLVYFFQPAMMIATGAYSYGAEYSFNSLLKAYVTFAVFGVTMACSYRVSRGARVFRSMSGIELQESYALAPGRLLLLFPLLVIPAVIAYYPFFDLIVRYGWSQFLRNRISLMAGTGYLYAFLVWPSIYTYLVVIHLPAYDALGHSKKGVLLFTGILAGAISTFMYFSLGSRTNALFPILLSALLFVLVKRGGKVEKKYVVRFGVLVLVFVVVAGALGAIRQQLMIGNSNVFEGIADNTLESVLDYSSASLGVSEHVMWWFDNPNTTYYLNGASFAAALVGWIPRRLWPAKPTGAGPALVNMRNPGQYDLSRGVNLTSITPGLVMETLMNFGWVGLPIIAWIFGKIIGILSYIAKDVRTPIQLVFWIHGILFSIQYLIGEVFGVTTKVFMLVLPFLLLSLLQMQKPKSGDIGKSLRPSAPRPTAVP